MRYRGGAHHDQTVEIASADQLTDLPVVRGAGRCYYDPHPGQCASVFGDLAQVEEPFSIGTALLNHHGDLWLVDDVDGTEILRALHEFGAPGRG